MKRGGAEPPKARRAITVGEIDVSPANHLTLPDRSVALPEHVRELLDWLIDEELERWRREKR
jgi:hypothetical protein